ncbi:choline dehydrogenase-like flavoprotein [Aliiruegeria haliotis]|uniref:Choline dehydrogenase-like flavoprotein n=1 Tax=Aliiruegeria haliotis TaxID=1280846 RepID=A0A2T0RLL7_9RHOB|nr:GMC family oxidoreductase N-terminal domain-containing protein [Aliiruegeria haliotis]PRY22085.1 choline dehydrogenase-like flavoprotein [Aliiruegeria haliotis]
MESFDHIVVGGGASGCVVAARLAEAGHRTLLLEAGHSHHHPLLDMPPGIFKLINGSKYMVQHQAVPQAQLGGRQPYIPQGNVLGGGSTVNGQVYMRGRPSDYDRWDAILQGSQDYVPWDFETCLPVFTGMEDNNRLLNRYHGTGGPLKVSDPGHIEPASRWWVQAVQAMGEPFNTDFCGESQRGAGYYQFMNRDGKRSSAAYSHVEPLRNNPNLTVKLQSPVHRVVVEKGRAVGVTYADKSGVVQEVRAEGEVIVTAGALVTPKILLLSGIGAADHLNEVGVDVVHDLPGVGATLIDHAEVPITAYFNGRHGYHKQGEGWRMLLNGLQFMLFGTGRVCSTGVECGAFVNPIDREAEPTIQTFCVNMVYIDRDAQDLVENRPGVTVATSVIQPKSKGWLRLASSDPKDMPLVNPNMLSHEDDMTMMVEGQKFFCEVFNQDPLRSRIKEVVLPSPETLKSDAAIAEHCRRFAKTGYHPCCTAPMGHDNDPLAVLDPRLRVRGIEGLRVCDMSATPYITAGNTNAPAMMIADRCADMILGNI